MVSVEIWMKSWGFIGEFSRRDDSSLSTKFYVHAKTRIKLVPRQHPVQHTSRFHAYRSRSTTKVVTNCKRVAAIAVKRSKPVTAIAAKRTKRVDSHNVKVSNRKASRGDHPQHDSRDTSDEYKQEKKREHAMFHRQTTGPTAGRCCFCGLSSGDHAGDHNFATKKIPGRGK